MMPTDYALAKKEPQDSGSHHAAAVSPNRRWCLRNPSPKARTLLWKGILRQRISYNASRLRGTEAYVKGNPAEN